MALPTLDTVCQAALLVLLVLVVAAGTRRMIGGSADGRAAQHEGFYGLYPYEWPPYARYWRSRGGHH